MEMIPCAERIPSEDDAVLVDAQGLNGERKVPMVVWGNKLTGKLWCGDWRFPMFATHWAPLPNLMR